ncbi:MULTISPECIES: MFS transporter [unclassified Leptolyngbya]|uniref:MFS transporter n=1 Tax=unclassified Leptolyngbya TaxID=2650499 RepID=UPI0016829918|nr:MULTISPECIES: MFS transporter [unclassified Leptolyngbya]MBD1910021.1 MFS transporter [Leptolyngbya sp. FACHB-8]MBD2156843.1 MFS transporter [Leptolyngbya sp. FACHB-16]
MPLLQHRKRGLNLSAFQSRNYRLFFLGQGLSMTGTFMTQIATVWIIYDLTHSALLLGITGFLGQLPTFLLAPFSGVLADRWNRHRLLILIQLLGLVNSALLTLLNYSNHLSPIALILLSTVAGLMRGLDVPVRQAFVIEMVDRREDLTSAIALNSALINAARLVGPAIAGVLIAAVGAGSCFLLDTLSYGVVIAALMLMQVKEQRSQEGQSANMWQRLREGWNYAYHFLPIRSLLLLLATMSLLGMSYLTLLPIVAVDILGGGSETLGFLTAASGVGALTAAIYLSSRHTVVGLVRLIACCPALLGVSLIVFSQSRILWFSLLLMGVAGFSSILQAASTNTVIQTIVDDSKRGRVMSFYAMSFMGMAPFGHLLLGSLASLIGTPNTLILGGCCCVISSLIFAKQLPHLRQIVYPIYVNLGILS